MQHMMECKQTLDSVRSEMSRVRKSKVSSNRAFMLFLSLMCSGGEGLVRSIAFGVCWASFTLCSILTWCFGEWMEKCKFGCLILGVSHYSGALVTSLKKVVPPGTSVNRFFSISVTKKDCVSCGRFNTARNLFSCLLFAMYRQAFQLLSSTVTWLFFNQGYLVTWFFCESCNESMSSLSIYCCVSH